MQRRDISFATPLENIAFDDALLALAEKQGTVEYLRFWESSQTFIVLGRMGSVAVDVHAPRALAEGVALLRRSSGGGTVLQGCGCLNYSLILSKQRHPAINDLRQSYAWIGARVIQALRQAGVEAYFKPISDLATGAGEKKFSGNAQRRAKGHILHHGTVLYDFDLSLISRYLRIPEDMPVYRQGRAHTDFVTNVAIDPSVFKEALSVIFGAAQAQPLNALERQALEQTLKETSRYLV